MKRMRKAAIGLVIVAPLVAGGFIAQERATQDGGRLLGQVLDLVQSRFVDSVDEAMLYEKAARGLVNQLQDPYSELLAPRDLAQFNTTTGGRYGGLGMSIEQQPGKGTVVGRVYHNTPAEEGGVIEGDLIVAVDTLSTRGWTNARVADSLRGTPNTKVTVTFARPGVNEPIKTTFTRRVVNIPAVGYAITFDGVGYLPLDNFNTSSTRDIATAIRAFQAQRVKGVILDLRGNPGGFLDQALSISNLFLPQGIDIASVRGRGAEPQVYTARERPIAPDLPIVVLIDQYSASAAEIVAGALQDHDRALILGTTSFGKGLVQTVYNLDGGYALKMTTGKWYTPAGRSIQKERKLLPDGQFVEVHPDSIESDSARKARPTYKSTAGRLLYGGGAITPDIAIRPDTFTSPEQALLRALASKRAEYYVALYDFGVQMRSQIKPDFTVTAAMRDELYDRIRKKGVEVDRAVWDAGQRYITRDIENRFARMAFGDSTARRRSLPDDPPLQRAIAILKNGPTTKDLIALAARPADK